MEVCKLAIRVQAMVLPGKLEHIITGNSMLAFGALKASMQQNLLHAAILHLLCELLEYDVVI